MNGSYIVHVKSKRVDFYLKINKNITIINGDSGTGKTTLVRMILQSLRPNSPYTVECDVPCKAITFDNIEMMNNLESYKESIIFIDDDIKYVRSREFADRIKNSSCYFVIMSREDMSALSNDCVEVCHLTYDNNRKCITMES